MRVAVIYLNVIGKSDENAPPPEHYAPWTDRFIRTYKAHAGDVPHRLQVVHCGGIPSKTDMEKFSGLDAWHTNYCGGGWDIGAHQYAALSLSFDFVICMATPCYFWRAGFIECMVIARSMFGDGVYAPMCSYENKPHVRHCCWAFDPKTFAEYPHRIDTRSKTFRAESGDLSITEWYESKGLQRVMVAPSGMYDQSRWREPDNIFRRGNQENCFVRDRHWDMYFEVSPERRKEFEDWADGKNSAIY